MLLEPAKESLDALIIVGNISKSLHFYQEILGLTKTEELQTPFGTSHRLSFGTSLIKILDPVKVPPAGPTGLDQQLGIRFLSFRIRNIRDVCVALRQARVEFAMPEAEVMPGMRVAMIKDPDGNIIELVEYS